MKSDISIDAIKQRLTHVLGRYHFLLFFIVLSAGIGAAILFLNSAIAKSDEANGYTSNVNTINFDTQTIDRIRKLKSQEQATDQIESNGRTNPF